MGLKSGAIVFVIFFYIFILTIKFALAVGISGESFYEKIFFEPGLEKTYTYYVLSNTNREMIHNIIIDGNEEIIQYFKTDPEYLLLKPNEQKPFKLSIKLPQKLDPGKYRAKVCVVESETRTPVNNTGIGSRAAVCIIFEIYSPIPGKYIEASLKEIKNIDYGENSSAKVGIINLGTENVNIIPYIEIKKDNETVKKIKAKEIYLPIKTEIIKEIPFQTEDLKEGQYEATIILEYDSKIILLNGTFSIGKPSIEIINFTNQLKKSKLNVFKIKIKNLWNKKIENIFANIKIIDQNNNTVVETTTNVISLEAFEEKEIKAYLDIGNYEGNFTILIEVNLPKEKVIKKDTIEIKSEIELKKIVLIIIALIILTLLIAIIIKLLKKHLKNKKIKSKSKHEKKNRKKNRKK